VKKIMNAPVTLHQFLSYRAWDNPIEIPIMSLLKCWWMEPAEFSRVVFSGLLLEIFLLFEYM
jgi:hypothetical protein